ncbi:MAG: 16S rRNA (guanine(966)-N(2))-methyltransferase RsmD [Oscillospiraceae bacterium]|nr:16S rRNA (guanine(966)-N(2))-methyltransferase RsmD [Oscillospiraceae bacterium]
MRVIAGSARGRLLKTLEGEATRPTTDKVKGAMFNIIQFELEGSRVLDLFSGSGQLAIEAISRGAKSAIAVDNSKSASLIIRENIKTCGFENEISVHTGDYLQVLTKGSKYDVIFLDPPYMSGLLFEALRKIAEFDILAENGIIICETDASTSVSEILPEGYSVREYRYGRIKLTVIRN